MSEVATGAAPSTPTQTPSTSSNANSGSTMHVPSGGQGKASQGSGVSGSTDATNSTPQTGSSSEHFEVKVNGKTVKMSRDELIAHAAKSQAADQRFEEAARLRREASAFEEKVKKNQIQALMDLGYTREQIRDSFEKWYSQEFIEPEALTPEQKKARDNERELEKYRQSEKERQEKDAKEQEEKLTAQQREYFSNQIIEAMEKSGLPKTKFFAQRMAFYMRQNALQGWDAPLDLIVSQVKKERQEIMSDLTENTSVDQIISLMGENVINKIRKHDLEQLRSRRQNQGVQKTGLDGYGNVENSEKLNYSDVNKRLRDMRMGKF